ncbi:putative bifunctional diguanylate cyclase/phosphodiesterase [Afifella marina]|uniref:putative bifunctional diguanylate cyclase/phosphodiesterase n=1 Tax=Afifella marina TaxID=1080 RepID=UPI001475DFED|nr:EAL domain-containing protein [Afifella marina]
MIRTLLIIAAAAAVGYAFSHSYDFFEALHDFSRHHESWELDEIFGTAVIMTVVLLVVAIWRVVQLRREIAAKEMAQREAQRLARHDVLTGLPNRRRLFEIFDSHVITAQEAGRRVAVLVIDLDRFKPVNDLHGHQMGDEVLCVVAERLTRLAEGRGVVARFGGDEFAALLEYQDGTDELLRLVHKIVHEMALPIRAQGISMRIGASVGVAVYPDDGTEANVLLRNADIAMYHVKAEERGSFHFFKAGMDSALLERIELEQQMDEALGKREIVPYLQPVVDLKTGGIVGFEMLARWLHPQKGVLLPDRFIAMAEDSGKLTPMTLTLLEQAMEASVGWPSSFTLSINLAPVQLLDPALPSQLLDILARAGFAPHRLEVELTETALVERMDEVKAVLEALRKAGIRVALDDFGTGYSGLYHLRELHLDTLKIDRSFIAGMLESEDRQAIVEAVLHLSQALGIDTTAEGIEELALGEKLAELGCQLGQGFYYSEPLPLEAVDDLIGRNRLVRASA